MQLGRTLCKLPKNKSPRLSELYEFCTGKKPNISSLHNSLYDTLFLCESISASLQIRIDLIKSYEKQLNESQANVAAVIQEPTNPQANREQTGYDLVV
jgi:hypothetical protein